MNMASLCSKGLGVLTAGLVLYDAHKNGLMTGVRNAKSNISDTIVDQYINSNNISKVSTVELNTKKTWFRFIMDNNVKEAVDSSLGYVKGAWDSFVSDIIPATLATGAILSKKNSKSGKLFGLGLVAYGVKYMLYDVMGIGKRRYLADKV